MATDNNHSTIDFQPDDQDNSGLKVDASAYALAAVFGPVALPAGMPDYLKAAILDRAEQDRDAAGDLVINNRMHPDDTKIRQAKAVADEDDNLSQWAQIVQQERIEHEHEEWSHTRSTVGGATMTGSEWAQFAERLRDDTELRHRLMEKFEKEGATQEEVETRLDRVTQAAKAASVPPGQRDTHQRELLADPQVGADIKAATALDKGPETQPKSALGGQFHAASNAELVSQTAIQQPSIKPIPAPVGLDF